MNASGIADKITGTLYNNAELIGLLGGVGSFGFQTFIDNVTNLPSGHFPTNIGQMLKEFITPIGAGYNNREYLKIYLIGWGLKEIGFGGGLGGAMQKMAVGLIKGNAIQHVVHYATH